jgi:CubicO group peptidase (beta-lactamase class C family)
MDRGSFLARAAAAAALAPLVALGRSTPAALGQTAPVAAGDAASRCDRYLRRLAALGRFSGSAEVRRDGELVFGGAYGAAALTPEQPATPRTQFEIASLSKMFTAFAALKLRDRGLLRLEDPVCDRLDDCPAHWRAVTIAHLIHHTSGIPDYEEALDLGSPAYMAFMAQPDAARRAILRERPLPLDFAPGTKFHYSNTGYLVLGTIVERVAGKPFGAFLRETIFASAGMRDTGTIGFDRPMQPTTGYEGRDIPWPRFLPGFRLAEFAQAVPPLPLTPPEGDAGVYSTAHDLARWNELMLHPDGTVVTNAHVREIFDGGAFGYGAGWTIGTDDDGRRRYRHTGELPGYLAVSSILPDERMTVVVLTNWTRSRPNIVANALAEIARGGSWDDPASGDVVTLDDTQKAALSGRYRFASGRIMTVSPDARLGLQAVIPEQFTAGLIPLSPTRFYFPLGDGTMTFELAADGRAERVVGRYSGRERVAERVA